MHTISPIDRAHAVAAALQHTRRQLCHQIAQLAARPDPAFVTGWPGLVAAAEAAFRHEESIMAHLAYPGLAAHREENARTLSALHHVTPQIDGGDTAIGRAALDALAVIVSSHRYRIGIAAVEPQLHGHKVAPDQA